MDAFRLHQRVIRDYHDYATSFINIKDERIDRYVRQELDEGALWPAPLLQLNPAYRKASTVEELVRAGLLHPGCAALFRDDQGRSFRLWEHQEQAIRAALRHEPYILTTGTGSGKSLTYLIPIVNHVLQHQPERRTVRAIIVYPMNALINSQLTAIRRLLSRVPGSFPVHFERYTGQENDQEKERIQQHPPHVLLTNYVMLELMLTRPSERVFVDRTLAEVQFLVLDELHTYTGRQGADVAMLVRRLRERCGNPDLLCIGTSATMVAGTASREQQRRTVAQVGEMLFGVPFSPENVIDETLERATQPLRPLTADDLRRAVQAGMPEDISYTDFVTHPLAIWIEETFGVEADESGHLRRRKPITLAQGAKWLAEDTGLPVEDCLASLQEALRIGNQLRTRDGAPVFGFKLHQFISQGGAVYATLEPPSVRTLTLEGRHYAAEDRVLAPLMFCRVCGQEYYQVRWDREGQRILPLIPDVIEDEDLTDTQDGYLLIEDPDHPVWWESRQDELPDSWFNIGKSGRTSVKKEFRDFIPRRLYVLPDGSLTGPDRNGELPDGATLAWFIPTPFLLCLHCGVVYTRQEREFRKLAQLSNEGRSTATTLLGISAVSDLCRQPGVPASAAKLLSFTDNRQDASLQAGHFNDFVQVAVLRAAIYRALQMPRSLDQSRIAQAVVKALNLPQEEYAKTSSPVQLLQQKNLEALTDVVEYRIYEELRRGWRVVQPNLEQVGLLKIVYQHLEDICADEVLWSGHPVLRDASPAQRAWVSRVFLDHLRRELAISADCLKPEYQQQMKRRVNQALKEPWCFDDDESENDLRTASWFLLPGPAVKESRQTLSLAPATAVGRFLRSTDAWPHLHTRLSTDEYPPLLHTFVRALVEAGYLIYDDRQQAVQVRADCLLWELGDGRPPEPDPIRSRRMRGASTVQATANPFFVRLYSETARDLIRLEGREHTAQVQQADRQAREEAFRKGELACLFCSPTMELGVDISDLNVVHMRNVPPTPANYAQRSGRAGRSSEPALVVTNCAKGSAHDQYFFRRPQRMVAGIVAPPQMDLANEELIKAHIHAIWLARVGLSIRRSITEVLDVSQPQYPLKEHVQHAINLSPAALNELLAQCQRVLESLSAVLERSHWYSSEWLERVLKQAPRAFDAAFDRWREMYAAAERQQHDARSEEERARHSGDKRAVDRAGRRATEASHQKDLLCNLEGGSETDFYPYRYLASEGFLPGYNFPRLPIRAYVASGPEGEFIARPRFLAIHEFAPLNVIYHEGRKYRVVRSQSVSGDLRERLVRAKLCHVCGYYHEGDASLVDTCQNCHTVLDADNSYFTTRLFEMADVITRRVERITCDEEERLREGYHLETYFRFNPAQGRPDRYEATVLSSGDQPLLYLTFGPAATLWRVNTGWKRSPQEGFAFNPYTGEWQRSQPDSPPSSSDDEDQILTGVRLLVRDTRHILLVRVPGPMGENEAFLASFQAALQQGIRATFQVGERELSAARLGQGQRQAILVWEDAEGGLGILENLIWQPDIMAQVAEHALDICHFDLQGIDLRSAEDPERGCARACYDCLMSYANQWDHPLLDRFLIRDFLLELRRSNVQPNTRWRTYEEQYKWLRAQIDPHSDLEYRFLDYLYQTRRRLPDSAQKRLPDYYAQVDFFYDECFACVFCDGQAHDHPEVKARDAELRRALSEVGYLVIEIRYDRDLEEQLAHYQDVFGP